MFRTKSRGSPTQACRIRAGQEGGKAPEATLQATELKVLSSHVLMGRGFVSHLSIFKMLQLFLALGLKETEGFLVNSFSAKPPCFSPHSALDPREAGSFDLAWRESGWVISLTFSQSTSECGCVPFWAVHPSTGSFLFFSQKVLDVSLGPMLKSFLILSVVRDLLVTWHGADGISNPLQLPEKGSLPLLLDS